MLVYSIILCANHTNIYSPDATASLASYEYVAKQNKTQEGKTC